MIVAHTSYSWLPRTQNWMYNQVRSLPKDIQVHIFCEKLLNSREFSLPSIHCFPNTYPLLYLIDKIKEKLNVSNSFDVAIDLAKKLKIDLLHSHFANNGWQYINVVKKLRLKHVVTFYGYDVNMLPTQYTIWRKRYQELFHSASLFCCEGNHMAGCLEKLGCSRNKIRMQHLGVDCYQKEFRLRFWERNKPFRILMAATFQEKKGIPYGLEALGELAKKVPIEITIIGDANLEPETKIEKKNILKIIEQCRLGSCIKMLGYQPYSTLLKESYQHHLFLAPSCTAKNGDTEGGAPVTILEMMAVGLPVVSTFHCDIPEQVLHEKTGRLAQERDVEGLLQQILWFIDHYNSSLFLEMMGLARKRVEDEFNIQKQGEMLAEIYRSLF